MILTIRTLILFLMMLLCGSVMAQTQPPATKDDASVWKEFSSAEGGFTVSLPGTPKADVTELNSNKGPLKTHFFTLEVDDLAFYISYADVSVSPKTAGEREAALDRIRDQVASRHRILNERIITLDGVVGRELLIRREIGLIMRGMFFYAKGRLYYLIITVPPTVAFRNGEPSTNQADLTELFETTSRRFFGSFKLTK